MLQSGLQKSHSGLFQEAFQQGFQSYVKTSNVLAATSVIPVTANSTFYSTIVGRASIPDISADLRASFGTERTQIQQIYQLQNEFGSNGEAVYGVVNDDRGLIRLVGQWAAYANSNGAYLNDTTTTDYIEITFFGTGLNLLTIISSTNQDIRVSVDGGAEGSNIYPSTASNSAILGGRNYASNQILPCISGLVLGVHTAKIRMNGSVSSSNISGFEILNTNSTTSLNLNPGTAYVDGLKVSAVSAQSVAYNSAFESGTLGTRGGHVVTYLKTDGTIGRAVTPTNVATAIFTSADHTNEEIVRQYNFREFGAARTDDFSLVSSSSGAGGKAFTLDDGTTTLVSDNLGLYIGGSQEGIYPSALNNFITLTFVGTGLDVINVSGNTSSTWQYQVLVDGVSQGTPASAYWGNGLKNTVKICSGLPYGAHTVKFAVAASGGIAPVFNRFIVYQPKKPALPAGTVELADYNVMANYVANTSASALATGILRKSPEREVTAVGAGIGIGINGLGNGYQGQLLTNAANPGYFQYTFFGTGFEYRFGFRAQPQTTAFQISVDGVTNLSSIGATSSYGAGFSFVASTGTVTQSNANSLGNGVQVSGLTLGIHTVRITLTTSGQDYIAMENLDIITPIHSVKSNLNADLQNTLPVGSCGISDNRQTTLIKNPLPATKAWAQTVGIQTQSSTLSTYIPLADMSVTIKTSGGPLKLIFTGSASQSSVGTFYMQFYVDGVPVGDVIYTGCDTANFGRIVSNTAIVPVSAGVHKVDAYGYGNAGTWSLNVGNRVMTVEEK